MPPHLHSRFIDLKIDGFNRWAQFAIQMNLQANIGQTQTCDASTFLPQWRRGGGVVAACRNPSPRLDTYLFLTKKKKKKKNQSLAPTYKMVVLKGTGGIFSNWRNMQRTVVRKQRHLTGHLTLASATFAKMAAVNTTSTHRSIDHRNSTTECQICIN